MKEVAGLRRTAAARTAGIAAGACFALALAVFGAALDGYSHRLHPVALLGAADVPRAGAFNAFAYVLPGLLAAFVALRRRGDLVPGVGASARLGWTMALLAALAFAAQGLLPLDPSEPDAGAGRLHGAAWGVWGIAFAAAAAALALAAASARRVPAAAGHAAAGLFVFALAWLAGDALPVAVSQRAACACWFGWLAWVGWTRAASRAGD